MVNGENLVTFSSSSWNATLDRPTLRPFNKPLKFWLPMFGHALLECSIKKGECLLFDFVQSKLRNKTMFHFSL